MDVHVQPGNQSNIFSESKEDSKRSKKRKDKLKVALSSNKNQNIGKDFPSTPTNCDSNSDKPENEVLPPANKMKKHLNKLKKAWKKQIKSLPSTKSKVSTTQDDVSNILSTKYLDISEDLSESLKKVEDKFRRWERFQLNRSKKPKQKCFSERNSRALNVLQEYETAAPQSPILNKLPLTSSCIATSDLFNNLNLRSVDEEDEFLYGDSNFSISETQVSIKESSITNNANRLNKGWRDEEKEEPHEDDGPKIRQLNSTFMRNLPNFDSEDRIKVTVNFSHIGENNPDDKTPLVETVARKYESGSSVSLSAIVEVNPVANSSVVRNKSKYRAAAEILKKRTAGKTNVINNSSREKFSDFEQTSKSDCESDDEFLYGDSNSSIPEKQMSIKESSVTNDADSLNKGWTDEEEEDQSEDVKPKLSQLNSRLMRNLSNCDSLNKIKETAIFPHIREDTLDDKAHLKEIFAQKYVSQESDNSFSLSAVTNENPGGNSSVLKKKSKYHAAPEILKKHTAEKTNLMSNNSREKLSDFAQISKHEVHKSTRKRHNPKMINKKHIKEIKEHTSAQSPQKRICPHEDRLPEKYSTHKTSKKFSPPGHHSPHRSSSSNHKQSLTSSELDYKKCCSSCSRHRSPSSGDKCYLKNKSKCHGTAEILKKHATKKTNVINNSSREKLSDFERTSKNDCKSDKSLYGDSNSLIHKKQVPIKESLITNKAGRDNKEWTDEEDEDPFEDDVSDFNKLNSRLMKNLSNSDYKNKSKETKKFLRIREDSSDDKAHLVETAPQKYIFRESGDLVSLSAIAKKNPGSNSSLVKNKSKNHAAAEIFIKHTTEKTNVISNSSREKQTSESECDSDEFLYGDSKISIPEKQVSIKESLITNNAVRLDKGWSDEEEEDPFEDDVPKLSQLNSRLMRNISNSDSQNKIKDAVNFSHIREDAPDDKAHLVETIARKYISRESGSSVLLSAVANENPDANSSVIKNKSKYHTTSKILKKHTAQKTNVMSNISREKQTSESDCDSDEFLYGDSISSIPEKLVSIKESSITNNTGRLNKGWNDEEAEDPYEDDVPKLSQLNSRLMRNISNCDSQNKIKETVNFPHTREDTPDKANLVETATRKYVSRESGSSIPLSALGNEYPGTNYSVIKKKSKHHASPKILKKHTAEKANVIRNSSREKQTSNSDCGSDEFLYGDSNSSIPEKLVSIKGSSITNNTGRLNKGCNDEEAEDPYEDDVPKLSQLNSRLMRNIPNCDSQNKIKETVNFPHTREDAPDKACLVETATRKYVSRESCSSIPLSTLANEYPGTNYSVIKKKSKHHASPKILKKHTSRTTNVMNNNSREKLSNFARTSKNSRYLCNSRYKWHNPKMINKKRIEAVKEHINAQPPQKRTYPYEETVNFPHIKEDTPNDKIHLVETAAQKYVSQESGCSVSLAAANENPGANSSVVKNESKYHTAAENLKKHTAEKMNVISNSSRKKISDSARISKNDCESDKSSFKRHSLKVTNKKHMEEIKEHISTRLPKKRTYPHEETVKFSHVREDTSDDKVHLVERAAQKYISRVSGSSVSLTAIANENPGSNSSVVKNKSKYHVAAEILKKHSVEKMNLISNDSREKISDFAQTSENDFVSDKSSFKRHNVKVTNKKHIEEIKEHMNTQSTQERTYPHEDLPPKKYSRHEMNTQSTQERTYPHEDLPPKKYSRHEMNTQSTQERTYPHEDLPPKKYSRHEMNTQSTQERTYPHEDLPPKKYSRHEISKSFSLLGHHSLQSHKQSLTSSKLNYVKYGSFYSRHKCPSSDDKHYPRYSGNYKRYSSITTRWSGHSDQICHRRSGEKIVNYNRCKSSISRSSNFKSSRSQKSRSRSPRLQKFRLRSPEYPSSRNKTHDKKKCESPKKSDYSKKKKRSSSGDSFCSLSFHSSTDNSRSQKSRSGSPRLRKFRLRSPEYPSSRNKTYDKKKCESPKKSDYSKKKKRSSSGDSFCSLSFHNSTDNSRSQRSRSGSPRSRRSRSRSRRSRSRSRKSRSRSRRSRSRSPRSQRSRSRSPRSRRSRSRSPRSRKSRSKSPRSRKSRSKSPRSRKSRSKSPRSRKSRSKSPRSRKSRSRSSRSQRSKSRSPRSQRSKSRSPRSQRSRSRSPRYSSSRNKTYDKKKSKSPKKSDNSKKKISLSSDSFCSLSLSSISDNSSNISDESSDEKKKPLKKTIPNDDKTVEDKIANLNCKNDEDSKKSDFEFPEEFPTKKLSEAFNTIEEMKESGLSSAQLTPSDSDLVHREMQLLMNLINTQHQQSDSSHFTSVKTDNDLSNMQMPIVSTSDYVYPSVPAVPVQYVSPQMTKHQQSDSSHFTSVKTDNDLSNMQMPIVSTSDYVYPSVPAAPVQYVSLQMTKHQQSDSSHFTSVKTDNDLSNMQMPIVSTTDYVYPSVPAAPVQYVSPQMTKHQQSDSSHFTSVKTDNDLSNMQMPIVSTSDYVYPSVPAVPVQYVSPQMTKHQQSDSSHFTSVKTDNDLSNMQMPIVSTSDYVYPSVPAAPVQYVSPQMTNSPSMTHSQAYSIPVLLNRCPVEHEPHLTPSDSDNETPSDSHYVTNLISKISSRPVTLITIPVSDNLPASNITVLDKFRQHK